MQLDKKQVYMLIGAMGVVVVIALLTHKQKIRRRNEEEIAIIQQHIENGTGGIGNNSVQNNLHGIIPDSNYNAGQDVKTIWDAKGFFWDDEETAITVFKNKTKRQIAQIREVFESTYNRNLEEYLWSFMNDEEYGQVQDIIKEAP